MIGIDFSLGMVATLSAEFLLAHAWLWYSGGGSNTISRVVSTVETDYSRVKGIAVTGEQKLVADARVVESMVKSGGQKIGDFVQKMTHTSSGSTPVPEVVMSAPGQ